MNEIIRWKKLSEKANLEELYYRNNIESKDPRTDSWGKWVKKIRDGRLSYVRFLKRTIHCLKGQGLELGAGSCWFSSEVSKIKEVKKIYCVDFSEYLLQKIAPKIMKFLDAKTEKITRVIGDFNSLRFEDNTFDFILVDAALHHATDLTSMLREARRVLKKRGCLIAIREPIVPLFRPWTRSKFGLEDKKFGITENIYSMKEWRQYFQDAGFKLELIPFIPKRNFKYKLISMIPFKWLNGLIFTHYIFKAKK